MNIFILFVLCLLCYFTSLIDSLPAAPALPSGLDLPYPVAPLQFTGTLGGFDIQLNGSVQEVIFQIQSLHLDFKLHNAAGVVNDTVVDRAASNKNGLFCTPITGRDWQACGVSGIQDGINELNSLGGNGRIGLAARSCGSLSCSQGSAIWLCNDEFQNIDPSAGYIATYAQDIINVCSHAFAGAFQYPQAGGQEFDSDSYNIIVRQDNC